MSEPKELDFFVAPEERPDPVTNANWERGCDWYAAHFDPAAPVRGESSPNYTAYPNAHGIPARAAEVVPDAALIYLVRDPIERIVSHYLHRVESSGEARPFDDVLGDIDRGSGMVFVDRSRYFMQIEQWVEHFPRERLQVVAQEDLKADRAETMRRVFRFLGVDDSFASEGFEATHQASAEKRALAGPTERAVAVAARRLPGKGGRVLERRLRRIAGRRLPRPAVSAEWRARLTDLLRDDVERLRAFTGQRFESWSV
jgi:hypothetical protein